MDLSIIIPVYNVAPYIERCLNSIFALDIPKKEMEVICIDDCSPDNSCAIIEEYQKRYPNLRLIHHKKNLRQGGARNTGIREAKGEYCMFVDADDSLSQMDVLAHIDYMRKNDLELLLGRANVIGAEGTISKWGNSPDVESTIMPGPDIYVDEFVHKLAFGVVWLGIYKTELVRRTAPFLEKVQYEDTDWTLRCAYEAKRLQYKPIVIYNYHNNPGTTTTARSIKKLIERIKQSLRIYEWALTTKERHDEVVFAAEDAGTWNLRGLSSLVRFGYNDRKTFYRSFTKQELRTMSRWWGGNYTKMYVKYPVLSQFVLCMMHPAYRLYKGVKELKR